VLRAEVDAADRHSRTLRSLSWNPGGDVLAVTSFDASTSLWQEAVNDDESSNGLCFECVGLLTGHENEVKSAAFSPSGEYLATCSRDKSVWIYETAKNFEYECIAVLQSHTQDVKMVAWHPGQDILFSCSYDDTIKIWGPDGDDFACRQTLSGHANTVWCLGFDPEGSRLVSSSGDKTLRIWAPENEATKNCAEAPTPTSRGASVAAAAYVSPLFRATAAATSAAVTAPASGSHCSPQPRRAPPDAACEWQTAAVIEDHHTRPIYSVDWLPFGTSKSSTSIATASGDNCVRVLQPQNEATLEGWTCVAEVEAHFGDANCVAWCPKPLPDGAALLASAGDDAEVVIWHFSG